MTTKVTVHAHCPSDVKVKVSKTGESDVYLADGETYENVVFDELAINVSEVLENNANTQGSTQTPPKKTEE